MSYSDVASGSVAFEAAVAVGAHWVGKTRKNGTVAPRREASVNPGLSSFIDGDVQGGGGGDLAPAVSSSAALAAISVSSLLFIFFLFRLVLV